MQPDVILIGAGMGGATYAAALAPSGRQILILERGQRLQPSPQIAMIGPFLLMGLICPLKPGLNPMAPCFSQGTMPSLAVILRCMGRRCCGIAGRILKADPIAGG